MQKSQKHLKINGSHTYVPCGTHNAVTFLPMLYARSIPPAFLGVVGLDAPINLFSSNESEINVFAISKASVCPTLNITSCDLEALRAEVKKAVPFLLCSVVRVQHCLFVLH